MKRVVLLITLACFALAPAYAETISGVTLGCFGTACVPAPAASTGGLGFQTGAFTAIPNSDGSVTGIGAIAGNNLGYFLLSSANVSYNGTFTLTVAFTAPPGTNPPTGSYNATFKGHVTTVGNGLLIDFDNSYQFFSSPAGNFAFNVNDVSLTAGTGVPVAITGNVYSTPEPASMLFMALGLGGFGVFRRRK